MRSRHALFGLRQNAEEFPIEASISHFSLHEERFYTVMLRDVTQRKHDEAELDRSHRELHKLTAALGTLREKEHKWLAQEIHDDLGQLLMTLKLDIATLRQRSPQGDLSILTQLDCIQGSVDAMVTSVRRIIADLRPKDLDDLGLFPALECLLLTFSKRHHIACRFEAPTPAAAIPDESAAPIYRMVQEALSNVVKHAHATQVAVQISCSETQTVLSIADNGTGISDADLRKEQSYGVIGIRERARSLSGEMSISNTPGGGVTIRVVLPAGHSPPNLQQRAYDVAVHSTIAADGAIDPGQIYES
jgi:signal transduction histidine kinase